MVNIIVDKQYEGTRLDKLLSLLLNDLSRSQIVHLIDDGKCFVNQHVCKASYRVKEGDKIDISLEKKANDLHLQSEKIELDIVYEDDDIAIINKPQGMVVHPGNGNKEHTLANALLYHFNSLSTINGEFRPGIVHRIDKDTSGLICIAKNDRAHRCLAEQLAQHTMKREYIALVKGTFKENKGHIDLPIGRDKNNRLKMAVDAKNGKRAVTDFEVINRFHDYTLICCRLETGRTHQIRVHLAYIGHPVDSDPLYNKKNATRLHPNGQLLSAVQLTLIHPSSHKEMTFTIDLPQYFQEIISRLD